MRLCTWNLHHMWWAPTSTVMEDALLSIRGKNFTFRLDTRQRRWWTSFVVAFVEKKWLQNGAFQSLHPEITLLSSVVLYLSPTYWWAKVVMNFTDPCGKWLQNGLESLESSPTQFEFQSPSWGFATGTNNIRADFSGHLWVEIPAFRSPPSFSS